MRLTTRPTLLLSLALGVVLGVGAPPPLADARPARPGAKAKAKQVIVLDGKDVQVNWNDGDSFRVLRGPREGLQARLVGYNTLESYGPVHFWGDFDGNELYQTHLDATAMAQGTKWECTSDGEADAYGRTLVVCPELRERLVSAGLAHVYAYKTEPDPALLAKQHEAQDERRGMWAKGIPRAIVTSVHSFEPAAPKPEVAEDDEGEGEADAPAPGADKEGGATTGPDAAAAVKRDERPPRTAAFNGMADTGTGKVFFVPHSEKLEVCDVFCHSGSCMLYIPFDARYGAKKAPCLTAEAGAKNRMTAMRHLNQPLAPRAADD